MANLKVYERQSVLDVAVQHSGSIESIFDLASLNGLSVTDDLVPNDSLQRSEVTTDADVVFYYSTKGIIPSTAPSADDIAQHPIGGINYMGIQIDFIVS